MTSSELQQWKNRKMSHLNHWRAMLLRSLQRLALMHGWCQVDPQMGSKKALWVVFYKMTLSAVAQGLPTLGHPKLAKIGQLLHFLRRAPFALERCRLYCVEACSLEVATRVAWLRGMLRKKQSSWNKSCRSNEDACSFSVDVSWLLLYQLSQPRQGKMKTCIKCKWIRHVILEHKRRESRSVLCMGSWKCSMLRATQ